MPRAGHTVQYDTAKRQVRHVFHKAKRCGCRRLRLTAHIHNQNYRPSKPHCGFSTRPKAACPFGRHTVIKPHRPFGDGDISIFAFCDDRIHQAFVHSPTVEVKRRFARRRVMKGGVDIIRPAFERLNAQSHVRKGPQEAEHHGCFSGSRTGRRN